MTIERREWGRKRGGMSKLKVTGGEGPGKGVLCLYICHCLVKSYFTYEDNLSKTHRQGRSRKIKILKKKI